MTEFSTGARWHRSEVTLFDPQAARPIESELIEVIAIRYAIRPYTPEE
jgi:hypothetical protein